MLRGKDAEREMELWEHLAELRGRIIRALLFIVIGMTIAWLYYDPLRTFLDAPLRSVLPNVTWLWTSITQPFMVRMQVSLIAGVIFALPFVTLELWGFVAPGLTPDEKRGFHVVVPLSLFFFVAGVTAGYLVLPSAFRWFASFLTKESIDNLQQNPVLYFTFVAKMLLAFGLVFQLPVVLMFLGWIGVVNSKMLKQNWRGAIVATSVLGAIATPSNDAFTMVMMAIPLAALYLASIWLVGMVEKMRARNDILQESAGLGTS